MRNKYVKENLKDIVSKCLSIAQVCREIGIKPHGGNYRTLKRYFNEFDIDISHFTGKAWNVGKRYRKFGRVAKLEDILVKNSTYTNSNSLKKKLYGSGLKEEKCENEKCGISTWNGKKITLELDHVNGDNLDNRIENLRVLCPNCHSQTKTWRGKKKTESSISKLRSEEYEKRDSFEKVVQFKKKKRIKKNRSKCKRCGEEVNKRGNKFCSRSCNNKYFHENISKMPSAGELIHKFDELKSFLQVGNYYDVSDNAVRKWCNKHEIMDIIKK